MTCRSVFNINSYIDKKKTLKQIFLPQGYNRCISVTGTSKCYGFDSTLVVTLYPLTVFINTKSLGIAYMGDATKYIKNKIVQSKN